MRIFILTIAAVLSGSGIYGAINLTSPISEWTPLPYNGPNSFSDYVEDTQAESPDLDLVGYGNQLASYTLFDWQNTLGFRLRLGGDKSPAGFDGQAWVGADFNLDGNLDLFIGANKSAVTIHYPGDLENTSPSTTSIISTPLFTTASSPANFNWSPVGTGNDPDGPLYDIDGFLNPKNKSGVDYFLTFSLPFDAFSSAANSLDYIDGFSATSTVSYVLMTATQANSLNSDINGVDGLNNSSLTWVDIGAITPEISVDGSVIPEPVSMVLLLSGMSFLVVLARRFFDWEHAE